ncbi:methyltransferase [Ideonella sp. DXS29W]|uniref:Methyltransferase n=1 Tax=Ideonella lacteola TaxID=2984193 RepID=A0ABU9BMS7_9BURK
MNINPSIAPGLLTRWQSWRDQSLISADFRRRALRFWPSRWVARRRARALFDIVAGFVYSQTLLACVQLRLFDRLAEGPMTATALAAALELPADATHRLLDAAAALGLVERRQRDLFGLGPLGVALVDNAGLAALVRHHAILYADLQDPVALLRGDRVGRLASYWPYATSSTPDELPDDRVGAYSELMSASQPLVADEVLSAYRLRQHACLMDVGGGEGRFLVSAAEREPHLRLILFDLPPVVERARARLGSLGLGGRGTFVGGNFLADPLPPGADVISLVRVVHDQSDDGARHLMRAAFAALPPGGVLLVAEPMARTRGAEPMGDAYFNLYLLAMGRGRPRSAAELTRLLHEAGFAEVEARTTRLPLQCGLLVARKPG